MMSANVLLILYHCTFTLLRNKCEKDIKSSQKFFLSKKEMLPIELADMI